MAISEAPTRATIHWGLVWLIALAMGAALYFHEALTALGRAWMTAEYSHGPLIPVLSAFMFMRQLRAHPVPGGPHLLADPLHETGGCDGGPGDRVGHEAAPVLPGVIVARCPEQSAVTTAAGDVARGAEDRDIRPPCGPVGARSGPPGPAVAVAHAYRGRRREATLGPMQARR